MKEKFVSKEYRDAISDAQLTERVNTLSKIFFILKEQLVSLDDDNLGINIAVLSTSMTSYYYDVLRAKKFHGHDRINKPKKAAYLIKWIVRDKPIWFKPEYYAEKKPSILPILSCINEIFALRVALGYGKIPTKLIDEELEDRLIYDMYFRPDSADTLGLWFETFMKQNGLQIE